jgi:hypothetical protein
MDELPFNTPPVPPEILELRGQLRQLRILLLLAVSLLLLLAGAVNIVLIYQKTVVQRELLSSRGKAQQVLEQYQRQESPAYASFVNQLVAFSRTNADFQPILVKYGLIQGSRPVAPSLGK